MMASVLTKLESLKFLSKDEDFALFSEQFEARMYLLKLRGVLLGTNTGKTFHQKTSLPLHESTVRNPVLKQQKFSRIKSVKYSVS